MQASGLVIEQAWLRDPRAVAVIDALRREGGIARYVGGCVRDAILEHPVRDIDIASDQPPEQVVALLESAGLKAVPTGVDHGTVTAVSDHKPFEITTLRVDVETHGRHATVAFTDDWREDAARRDFTLNALYCDPDGTVYDPVGGLDDLKAGRIRFIGDAAARIEEDALRILRFFRFHAWFGNGELDAEGLKACIRLKDRLDVLSVERLRAETCRLLECADPSETVQAMLNAGILAHILPEALGRDRLGRLVPLEREHDGVVALRRLAAMTDLSRAALDTVGDRWRFSNRDKKRLSAMADDVGVELSDPDLHAALYRDGLEAVCDRILLSWAGDGQDRSELLARAGAWKIPEFPLLGRDAVACGMKPGEAVGAVLKALEDDWIAADFMADRAALLLQLDARVAAL